jgi:hypothetical protein
MTAGLTVLRFACCRLRSQLPTLRTHAQKITAVRYPATRDSSAPAACVRQTCALNITTAHKQTVFELAG